MLDKTVESVNSAVKPARASMQRGRAPAADREPAPAANSPSEQAIVNKFVSAWEYADLDSLVALLTDDVFISMPPMPFEYEGRDLVARLSWAYFPLARHPFRMANSRKLRDPRPIIGAGVIVADRTMG
jgi:hypothetical protein